MKTKLALSILLLGFSVFTFIKFLNAELPQADVAITAVLLSSVLPAIAGLAFLIAFFRQKQQMDRRKNAIQEQNLNADIIRLADRKGSKLTIFEVMAEFGLNAEDAEHALNGLIMKRLAKRTVNDAGTFIYNISSVRRAAKRRIPKPFFQRRLA